jgi:hypothetical protein
MPKQLILSVGLNKTGTTSIQRTCFANRPALRRVGFTYPTYSLEPGAKATSHSALLNMMFFGPGRFRPNQGEMTRQHRELGREKLAQLLRDQNRKVLMVAEGVCEFDLQEMRDLRDWFGEQGYQIRVLCSVRHLATWTHSMAAQRVVGMQRMTLQGAIDEFARQGLVRHRIENIRAVFPDAEFSSYERAAAHPDGLVAAFLDAAGVPRDGLDIKHANTGRSDNAVRVMSVANEKFGIRSRQASAVAALKDVPGEKFALCEAEAAALAPLVDRENDWLRATLGAEFAGPPLRLAAAPSIDEAAIARAVQALPPPVHSWLIENRARWQRPVAAA